MARQTTRRQPRIDAFQQAKETIPERVPVALPAAGHVPDVDFHLISPGQLRLAQNVTILHSGYRTRAGTTAIGAAASGDLTYTLNFITSDRTSYFFRFYTNKVELWAGSTWLPVTGLPTLTATPESLIVHAAWNDQLIFSNGVDGTYIVNPLTGVATVIAAAGVADHLTVFGKRLIICRGNVVYWSIRGNYTDFTGLGSGAEDMLSTPGGFVDSLTGVYPVSDQIAFVVRSGSVWSMSETGNFDAPYQFTRSFPKIGSSFPLGVATIPEQGIILPANGSVFKITLQNGVEDIGIGVSEYIFNSIADTRKVCGVYDGMRNFYALFVPNNTSNMTVHICHLISNQWTAFLYPVQIRAIALGRYQSAVLTDDLVGQTDALIGQTDSLGVSTQNFGLVITPMDTNSVVIIEDTISSNNILGKDVTAAGVRIQSGFEIQTGLLTPIFNRGLVNDTQFVAKATRSCQISVAYTGDGAQSWEESQTLDISARSESEPERATCYLERKSLCARFRSDACGDVSLFLMAPSIEPGAAINA